MLDRVLSRVTCVHKWLTLGLVFLSSGTTALAQSTLTPHSAEYKIRISVLGGELTTELRATDAGYVAHHIVRPTGITKIIAQGTIAESSEFEFESDVVRPIHYISDDSLSRDKKRAEVDFDWNALIVRGTINDDPIEMVLEGRAHDRVSIQYELMHDLMNGKLGTRYILYDIDELKAINVTNIGRKQIRVPAGEFDAIGIQHQTENSSRVTTLWCVPELDYLPVLIEQHRDGKLRVRASLKEYMPEDTP